MRLLVAGGGTGGHLFPGLALGEEVKTRHPRNDVLFVGSARGIEAREVPKAGYPLEIIDVGPLKRIGLLGFLMGLFRLPRAFWQSMKVLRKFDPDVVIGVGGYSSGPVLLVACLMRKPTAIQEQNALPGFTNRTLGHFVDEATTPVVRYVDQLVPQELERLVTLPHLVVGSDSPGLIKNWYRSLELFIIKLATLDMPQRPTLLVAGERVTLQHPITLRNRSLS